MAGRLLGVPFARVARQPVGRPGRLAKFCLTLNKGFYLRKSGPGVVVHACIYHICHK